jgi:hypothetical protein
MNQQSATRTRYTVPSFTLWQSDDANQVFAALVHTQLRFEQRFLCLIHFLW